VGSKAHPVSHPKIPVALSGGEGIKLPEREANHSPVPSVEVKKVWNYTSIPPYVFIARCLIKQRSLLSTATSNNDFAISKFFMMMLAALTFY
jgi:hypothetical protein